MGYDRGDRFSFDFEPIGTPFGSKSKGILSPRSYPIQFERKWKSNFLRVLHRHFYLIVIEQQQQQERASPGPC